MRSQRISPELHHHIDNEEESIKTRTTAATVITAATMANPTSTPLTRDPPPVERAGAGLDAAGAAERGAGAWAAVGAGGAAAEAVATVAATGAAGAGVAAATEAGAGILIVGAAVGLGGKLMRTVSFLG